MDYNHLTFPICLGGVRILLAVGALVRARATPANRPLGRLDFRPILN